MIDANASSIENAFMMFGIGGLLILLALAVLCLLIALLRLRRRQPPPILSFFDVIGRREP